MPQPELPHPALNAAIVVPCYNEAARMPAERFEAFLAEHTGYAWCFVDDGSTDGTRALLERLCAPHGQRTCILALAENGGKAAAVRQGILHALETWPAPWVGYWDADLATPLEEIPRFVRFLRNHATVRVLCGSRWLHMGGCIDRPVLRHYIGRGFATLASNTLELPIYDTQCGAKLIETDLARTVFEEPFLAQWVFDVEMLARVVRRLGHEDSLEAIAEIPLRKWTDRSGSKVKFHHAFRIPWDLWRIRRRYFV